MDASTIPSILLGPLGALAVMFLGGRWLMARIEKAEDERAKRDSDFRTLVQDNTRAMEAMQRTAETALKRLEVIEGKVDAVLNGVSKRDVSHPNIQVGKTA